MGLETLTEPEILHSELEEKTRLVSVFEKVKEVAKEAAYYIVPFAGIRQEDYTIEDLFLDSLKSGFIVLGVVEGVQYARAGHTVDTLFALRNIGFWALTSIPHWYARVKSKFKRFGDYIEDLYPQLGQEETLNKKQKTMLIADQMMEDKAAVALFMLSWLIETGYKISYLHYGPQYIKLETEVGVGPTMPQHYAIGVGLTRLIENAQLYWAKTNNVSDEEFGVKAKNRAFAGFVVLATLWEIFEKVSPLSSPPIWKDTVIDMFIGAYGSLTSLFGTSQNFLYAYIQPLIDKVQNSRPLQARFSGS